MLAEDNPINREIALIILRKAGYHVDAVENGVEAVSAVRRHRYELVLMDVQMPVMDGEEATKRIRALEAPLGSVPIVALTAHAMAGARDRYLQCGMNDYLSKPFNMAISL